MRAERERLILQVYNKSAGWRALDALSLRSLFRVWMASFIALSGYLC
jgi:hypothetical protein